jgi:hypothetical protein
MTVDYLRSTEEVAKLREISARFLVKIKNEVSVSIRGISVIPVLLLWGGRGHLKAMLNRKGS